MKAAMEISLGLDRRKLEKGLKITEKQVGYLYRRATGTTARNLKARISKDSLGVGPLRRKKVIRARIRGASRGVGVWVGLNDISAAEFRGKKEQTNGGVIFRGQFFKGAFRGRFKHDPKSVSRILRSENGRLTEVLIPIEEDAQEYLETMIRPLIPQLFQKNFEVALDSFAHVKWEKR